jgi:RNA polymerase sigma-70 factor (ECF subfamily)
VFDNVLSLTSNPLLSLRIPGDRAATEVSISETAQSSIALLTGRIARGDDDAFEEFHQRYFDRLYHFLLVIAHGEEHEAQDALQETLLRVARHARVFKDEDAFWCWLKVIARNAARDGGRKRRRYLTLLQRFAWFRNAPAEQESREEDRLSEILVESLEELSAEDRNLIDAKYLQGVGVKELSVRIGVSDKAVESRLLRLRRHLRERILKKLQKI